MAEVNTVIRMSLAGAIASILGRKDHADYRNIKQSMKISDLYKLLGLTGSPMLYNYMGGKTKTIEAERAVVILDKFNVLVDLWLTEDELIDDAINAELSAQIAREPIKDIIEEIVEIEQSMRDDNHMATRRAMRKLIAKYY